MIFFLRSHLKHYFCAEQSKKNPKMAYVISNDCSACGTCLPECPSEAITEGDIYKIDADKCIDCGACVDVCPTESISAA
jgi:NAD-dependent dihydropyrimidine dehydrogenase PreA subunit